MSTEAILILLFTIVLHVLGAVILIRHRRNARHHRFTMGMIGSDPLLTETLHARMLQQQPETDWLNPHVLRSKVTAWQRRQREQGGEAES